MNIEWKLGLMACALLAVGVVACDSDGDGNGTTTTTTATTGTGGAGGTTTTSSTSSTGGAGGTGTVATFATLVDCTGATIAATVELTATAYDPVATTINVNDTVEFKNTDSAPHTATSGTMPTADGKWDTEVIDVGTSKCVKFLVAGTSTFFSKAAMNEPLSGTITIQ